MEIPTFNKFKSTTIYGNFVNDDYADNSVLASATFSGSVSGITQPTIDNSTQFATTAFVKNQEYQTTTAIASTYQTITSMLSYLTKSSAASTYQAKTDMASYLTSGLASSTYQTKAGMTSYLTTTIAVGVFQSISAMSSYAVIASPTFTGIASCATAPTTVNHLCNKTYVDSVLVNGSLNNQYSKSKILI